MTVQFSRSNPAGQIVVADIGDDVPGKALHIDCGVRTHFSGEDDQFVLDQRLARYPGIDILVDHGVDDRVRDLSATLSGWPSDTDSEVNTLKSAIRAPAGNRLWKVKARILSHSTFPYAHCEFHLATFPSSFRPRTNRLVLAVSDIFNIYI